jgi:hypothetical protein
MYLVSIPLSCQFCGSESDDCNSMKFRMDIVEHYKRANVLTLPENFSFSDMPNNAWFILSCIDPKIYPKNKTKSIKLCNNRDCYLTWYNATNENTLNFFLRIDGKYFTNNDNLLLYEIKWFHVTYIVSKKIEISEKIKLFEISKKNKCDYLCFRDNEYEYAVAFCDYRK